MSLNAAAWRRLMGLELQTPAPPPPAPTQQLAEADPVPLGLLRPAPPSHFATAPACPSMAKAPGRQGKSDAAGGENCMSWSMKTAPYRVVCPNSVDLAAPWSGPWQFLACPAPMWRTPEYALTFYPTPRGERWGRPRLGTLFLSMRHRPGALQRRLAQDDAFASKRTERHGAGRRSADHDEAGLLPPSGQPIDRRGPPSPLSLNQSGSSCR